MGLFSNLLPSRNALFELRLEIKDLANVPLVAGAFGTEWRFRKTKAGLKPGSVAGGGNGGPAASSGREGKGKGREIARGDASAVGGRPRSTSSLHPTLSRSTTLSRSSSTSSRSSSTSGSSDPSRHPHPHQPTTAKRSHRPHRSDVLRAYARGGEGGAAESGGGGGLSTKGRGETAVVDIADHACRWEQTVVANVRIPVEASGGGEEDKAGMLGERELYLSVYQYHSPEDSDRILRLGHLTLNLAEYAGRGPVVRRYLLDSGKTNATLKLEIELTQIGGQRLWVAPSISKGQLANGGLETLVNGSTVGSSVLPSSSTSGGGPPGSAGSNKSTKNDPVSGLSSSGPAANGSSATVDGRSTAAIDGSGSGGGGHHASAGKSSSSSRAAAAASSPATKPSLANVNVNEPRTRQGFILPTGTEAIIEALFNPFPSTVPGPFTFPPAPKRKPTDLSFVEPSLPRDDANLAVPSAAAADTGSHGRRGRLGQRWRQASGCSTTTATTATTGTAGDGVGGLGREVVDGGGGGGRLRERSKSRDRARRARHAEEATATEMGV